MFHSYMDALIFHCLKQLKEERTVYSAFHILSGKKSSQTIQDCYLFDISPYFRTYSNLTREVFDACISHLVDNGYIRITDEKGKYELTKTGVDTFHNYIQISELPQHINGFRYQNSLTYWKQFSLLFQVLSNGIHQNRAYLPIQRDITVQRWLKQFLYKENRDIESLANGLLNELEQIFTDLPDLNVQVFMMKLSGYHRVGYSVEQISKQYDKDSYHIHYLFLDVLHFLIFRSLTSTGEFPILSAVFQEDQQQHTTLTRSSSVTLKYLQEGYGIEDIMKIRALKRNTIEDHIVEIALHIPKFNLNPYIDDRLLKEIHSLIDKHKTMQLKIIKRSLPEKVTYFQIRLALAKKGGEIDEIGK